MDIMSWALPFICATSTFLHTYSHSANSITRRVAIAALRIEATIRARRGARHTIRNIANPRHGRLIQLARISPVTAPLGLMGETFLTMLDAWLTYVFPIGPFTDCWLAAIIRSGVIRT